MPEPGKGPYCGIASSLVLFVVIFLLTQWIGAGLLGAHAGATLLTAAIFGGIGVHAYCTFRLQAKRRAMGG